MDENEYVSRLTALKILPSFLRAGFSNNVDSRSYSRLKVAALAFKQKQPAAVFYPQMLGKKRFTIYVDTNHTDQRIQNFFYSQENANLLIEAGIKHVFIEAPKETQELYDALARSEIDEEAFIQGILKLSDTSAEQRFKEQEKEVRQYISLKAEFARSLHKHDIRIHCPDERSHINPKHLEKTFNFFADVQRYAQERGASFTFMHSHLLMSYLWNRIILPHKKDPEKMRAEIDSMREFASHIHTARSDDTQVAANILAHAHNEPSVVFFGGLHTWKKNDLDDLLGLDNSLRVEIYGDRRLYADTFMNMHRDKYSNPPNFSHMLDNDTVYTMTGLEPS